MVIIKIKNTFFNRKHTKNTLKKSGVSKNTLAGKRLSFKTSKALCLLDQLKIRKAENLIFG